MRIGINGTAVLGRASIDRIVAHVKQAADEGFPSYWLAQTGAVDALTTLALASREAPGIELGTAVIPTWFRHPFALAAQALTAQAATGGRIALGIGLSHQPVVEDRFHIPFERPVRHLREYLAVLQPLLTEGKVASRGEIWSGEMEFVRPEVDPPPVLVAALGKQTLRLTGRRADGTILWMVGPETIRSHIAPTIRAAAEQAGRPEPRIVASLPLCVTGDAAGVRERAAVAFARYGELPSYRAMLDREGGVGPQDVALIGEEDAVRAGIEALAEAGATDFAPVEFTSGDEERERTRSLLRSLL